MGIDTSRFKRNKDKLDSKVWTDWLTDAVPSATVKQELREKRVERASTYTARRPVETAAPPPAKPAAEQPASGVSIQISIPEWRRPQFKRTKAVWAFACEHVTRKQIITTSVVVGVLGVSWAGLAITKHHNDQKTALAAAAASQGKTLGAETKPTFTPAVPSSKQELVVPDGTHSRFDASKGSYSYYDNIGGKQFTVSEQTAGSADAAKTAASTAAKSLNAKMELKTGWGTAYMLTNQKYNSQTLVVGVRELLVFIQSSFTFTNDQWTTYLNSLQ